MDVAAVAAIAVVVAVEAVEVVVTEVNVTERDATDSEMEFVDEPANDSMGVRVSAVAAALVVNDSADSLCYSAPRWA